MWHDSCYAMLCAAMLCAAMLCAAMLCYALLCYAILKAGAGPRKSRIAARRSTQSRAPNGGLRVCYAMLCCAMLCYAVSCPGEPADGKRTWPVT